MSDTAAAAPPSPKKAAKPKKAKTSSGTQGPSTSTMVNAAIKSLHERHGSSLQAIKKYIVANYKVDVEKRSTHIRKYLTKAVDAGTLVRTKGKGASGSFKLGTSAASDKKAKKSPKKAVKKTAAAKKPSVKKSPAKKATAAKKKVAKKPAAGSAKKAAKPKKVSKPKPKTPKKAKPAASKKKATPKKK